MDETGRLKKRCVFLGVSWQNFFNLFPAVRSILSQMKPQLLEQCIWTQRSIFSICLMHNTLWLILLCRALHFCGLFELRSLATVQISDSLFFFFCLTFWLFIGLQKENKVFGSVCAMILLMFHQIWADRRGIIRCVFFFSHMLFHTSTTPLMHSCSRTFFLFELYSYIYFLFYMIW